MRKNCYRLAREGVGDYTNLVKLPIVELMTLTKWLQADHDELEKVRK